jgi:hypothetical protein
MASYSLRNSRNSARGFSAFDPDVLGALLEAYTFITQPLKSSVEVVDGQKVHRGTYDTASYNDLVQMMDRAIRKAGTTP